MALHINNDPRLRGLLGWMIYLARWLGRHYPETLVRIRYFVRFHRFLNLDAPRNLNEKIQYLSFRTDTSQWTPLTDKHAVRQYVKDRGLEDILIPQYAHCERAEEIDFDRLPEQFVIKTTHGSGDVLVVEDKSQHDIVSVRAYFAQMLKHRYGELEGGQHYMRIKPALTIEALLRNDGESAKYSSSIIDYKFWCFNGEPRYCMVCSNRDRKGTDLMMYDSDWMPHPEWMVFSREYRQGGVVPRPQNYERMLAVCRILADGFPCVCVDLYNIGGKIYFGELTFTRLGGLIDYYTRDWLFKAGSEIRLPQ